MDLGSMWVVFVCVFDIFFGVRALMRRNVPQVFQTFFPRHKFLERRPSEDLRSSLALIALPVLARKGLCWGRFQRENKGKSLLGALGAVLAVLGSQKGAQGRLLGGILGAKISQVGSKTAS